MDISGCLGMNLSVALPGLLSGTMPDSAQQFIQYQNPNRLPEGRFGVLTTVCAQSSVLWDVTLLIWFQTHSFFGLSLKQEINFTLRALQF
jgi:hypothetical protein